MNGSPQITIAELLAELNSKREWVRRFARGEEDAVIDEVIDAIAGGTLSSEERDALFGQEKRELVKSASHAELQAAVAAEWPGALIHRHVC